MKIQAPPGGAATTTQTRRPIKVERGRGEGEGGGGVPSTACQPHCEPWQPWSGAVATKRRAGNRCKALVQRDWIIRSCNSLRRFDMYFALSDSLRCAGPIWRGTDDARSTHCVRLPLTHRNRRNGVNAYHLRPGSGSRSVGRSVGR